MYKGLEEGGRGTIGVKLSRRSRRSWRSRRIMQGTAQPFEYDYEYPLPVPILVVR